MQEALNCLDSWHERANEALLVVVPSGGTGAERAPMHADSQMHLILVMLQSVPAILQGLQLWLTNVVVLGMLIGESGS